MHKNKSLCNKCPHDQGYTANIETCGKLRDWLWEAWHAVRAMYGREE